MSEAAEATPTNLTEVIKFAEKKFNQINPVGLNFNSEAEFCVQILQNNPKLMEVAKANPRTVVAALGQAAAIGLSLNPAKKECYLLSRNVKVAKDGKEAWESRIYLEPSYMGLNNVATNTGSIDWVQANVVRKNDKSFVDNGPGLRPTHIYDAFASNEERGEIVGAYCVAKAGDDYLTTLMNKEKLDSIRGRSETWKYSLKNGGTGAGTWLTDEEEMCKKAVMRNAFKTWPKTDKFSRMEQAVHISNENEGFEPLLTSPVLNSYTVEQKTYFDQMITENNALGMYCFLNTLDEGVRTSLHNSFEKGTITKYKAIVSKLEIEGQHKLADIRIAIEDAAEVGDDLAVKELLTDMQQEAIDYIKAHTEDGTRQFIDMCLTEEAAA